MLCKCTKNSCTLTLFWFVSCWKLYIHLLEYYTSRCGDVVMQQNLHLFYDYVRPMYHAVVNNALTTFKLLTKLRIHWIIYWVDVKDNETKISFSLLIAEPDWVHLCKNSHHSVEKKETPAQTRIRKRLEQ